MLLLFKDNYRFVTEHDLWYTKRIETGCDSINSTENGFKLRKQTNKWINKTDLDSKGHIHTIVCNIVKTNCKFMYQQNV